MHLLKLQMEEVIKLLNLIKNEYAKIFHKRNTYILLVLLLALIIAFPLLTKYLSVSDDYYYSETYEEAIAWSEEEGETEYVEMYKKAQELGISEDVFFGYKEETDWRVNALHDAYSSLWYEIYRNNDNSEEVKKMYEIQFNELLKLIENDDWKGYYRTLINQINSDSTLSESLKEAQTYIYQYYIDNNIEPDSDSWQTDAANTYVQNYETYAEGLEAQKNGKYYDQKAFADAERLTLVSKYRLDNNINAAIYESDSETKMRGGFYTFTGDFYNNMDNCSGLLAIVMIIIIVIAGGIISKEFSQGTIKFLLINPVKRSKIFWSKYITLVSYSLLLTIMTYVLEFIMSIIVFGPAEIGTQLLSVVSGEVIAQSGLLFMFGRYMLLYVEIFVAFTIAFMISSLFRNSSLAIALSLIIYFVGNTVCSIAAAFNLDFFRYTIFATMSISTIIDENSLFVHLTPGFAITVIAVHIFLLLFTAHDAFTKRNV